LLLADLGADVIKVEAPGGDGVRSEEGSGWVNAAIHRGKRSITLNLKHPSAADVLRRLVTTADVLIESARPGSMERMGVGYPELSAINPRLVWCSITSFGDGSPRADEAAHELNFFGFTGLLDTIYPEPRQTGAPFALTTTMGGVMAALGILAALRERDRTGVGSKIDTSIADSAIWLLSDLVVGHEQGVRSLPHDRADISTYTCADGRMITVSPTEPVTWQALVETIGLPHLRDRAPTTPQEHAEVAAELRAVFVTKTSAEWLDLLRTARASVGPVNAIADLFDDAHIVAREMIVERGGHNVVANPIRISSPEGQLTDTAAGGPPAIGADTTDVLQSVGYSDREIEELRGAGAL
jgi:crotonobetainyl-CoA:carnitine CoA-transferase CaiB-like acyl-CoA transferase